MRRRHGVVLLLAKPCCPDLCAVCSVFAGKDSDPTVNETALLSPCWPFSSLAGESPGQGTMSGAKIGVGVPRWSGERDHVEETDGWPVRVGFDLPCFGMLQTGDGKRYRHSEVRRP